MDLIENIRDEIINNDIDTVTILRKARVLSSILNNKKLEKWTLLELNGYKDTDNIPDYRIINVASVGNLNGPWGSSATNITLPISNFPKNIQDWAYNTEILEGISTLETLVKSNENLSIQWPAEFIAEVQSKVMQRMYLHAAWKTIPAASIVQIINCIRNNLLEFIISIKEKYPKIKDEKEYHNIKRKDVDSSFDTFISSSYCIK